MMLLSSPIGMIEIASKAFDEGVFTSALHQGIRGLKKSTGLTSSESQGPLLCYVEERERKRETLNVA
jgi:hypothetical protein